VPRVETVYIKNSGKEKLVLESISASSIHFYCSFFVERALAPGSNTSFDVYFLARALGMTKSSLYINTNRGIFRYQVAGVGVRNRYGLYPITNVRIPLNASYTHVIKLHNPTNYPMQILEIYASDDDLHLDIPYSFYSELNNARSVNNNNNIKSREEAVKANEKLFTRNKLNAINLSEKERESFSSNFSGKSSNQQKGPQAKNLYNNNKNAWYLNPFETRPIVFLRYLGHNANNHTAFVCIRTISFDSSSNEAKSGVKKSTQSSTSKQHKSSKDTTAEEHKLSELSFILPVELEVTDRPGLYSSIDYINFEYFTARPGYFLQEGFTPSIVSSLCGSGVYSPFSNDSFNTYGNFEKTVDLFLSNNMNTPVEIKV
jgi:hypothetical protein